MDHVTTTLSRLRLRQVRLLLALDERGTLGKAADVLGISQSAATKILQELEDLVGMSLLVRVGRGLSWTDAGRRVLEHFRSLHGGLVALGRDLKSLPQTGGRIFIGSTSAAGAECLGPLLLRLHDEGLAVDVDVTYGTSDQLFRLLLEGHLDFMLGRPVAAMESSRLRFSPLRSEELVIVAAGGHPLVQNPLSDFGALAACEWVLTREGSPMRNCLHHEFERHNQPFPRVRVHTSSLLLTMQLVRGSDMLTVAPRSAIAPFLAAGGVGVVNYAWSACLSQYGLIVVGERPQSAQAQRLMQGLASA